jgi:hypothetical protein
LDYLTRAAKLRRARTNRVLDQVAVEQVGPIDLRVSRS